MEENTSPSDTSVELVPLAETDLGRVVKVGFAGDPETRLQVIQLLREYSDVFAWSPADMTGVSSDIISHKLNISPSSTPVKQKKRTFAAERNQVIYDEVQQLLKSGILFEVIYPIWLSNPVVVKKEGGEWRMCVDYTDLNKASLPKRLLPSPQH